MISGPPSTPTTDPGPRPRLARGQVVLAYAAFVLVGISAGVGGVALAAQIADYGVDRTLIGLTFFTFSGGYLLGGFGTGPAIHRFGLRATLVLSTVVLLAASLATAARPPFVGLILLGVPAGFATGILESALNTQLAAMPRPGALLNRLHAFFGVGALVGPILATRLLQSYPWTAIWLVLALLTAPLAVGFALTHPPHEPPADPTSPAAARGLVFSTLRQRPVLLAAVLLSVYVGLEIGVGNWAYSFLVHDRELAALLAGNLVSGYWLGLTAGRFVIVPVTERLGWTTVRTSSMCLCGVIAAVLLIWAVPTWPAAGVGLTFAGFCLGPLFPTIMTVTPQLTEASRVPTAIGVLNGVSVIGGSLLPWFAGFLTDVVGLWTLWPYAIVLGAVQLVIWQVLARDLRPVPTP